MKLCEYLQATHNLRSSTREIRYPYLQEETGQLHCIREKNMFKPPEQFLGRSRAKDTF